MEGTDMTQPRRCFIVLLEQRNERGFIPSVVTEGEPGHSPMIGNGEFSQPWYWGTEFDQALEVCAAANADLGLSPEDVDEITNSSIAAQLRADGARDRFEQVLRQRDPVDGEIDNSFLERLIGPR
jgi:hypothetical protein